MASSPVRKTKAGDRSAVPFLVITFLACAVIIALVLPSITKAKNQYLGQRVAEAKIAQNKGDYSTAESILQRANWVSFGDNQVLLALGQTYQADGNLPAAIHAYDQLPFTTGYSRLGRAALSYQDYKRAQSTYIKAVDTWPTAENYAALAISEYNIGRVKAGCEAAQVAAKASLANPDASQAQLACLLLEDKFDQARQDFPALTSTLSNSPRAIAYALVKAGVVKPGEDKLLKINIKTTGDWLLLARIAAARGELKTAVARTEAGLKLNTADLALNQAAASYYATLDNQAKATFYRQRAGSTL